MLKNKIMYKEAVEAIIDSLDYDEYKGYYCDLHDAVFNSTYYTCYESDAKDALEDFGVLDAIDRVATYERDELGEVRVDSIVDPIRLVDMLWFVVGNEVIGEMYDIAAFCDNWDHMADEETNTAIIAGMRELFAEVL